MNELDLLVGNYFTDSFEASDLFRLVEEVMSETSEGQTGTAFEDVLIAVAQGDKTGGTSGNKTYTPKGKKRWKGLTFTQLSIACLEIMGYTREQIKAGVDPDARKASGAGVSGDPKTDVIINGKQISLKLPGDIQFTSGEAKSTADAVRMALEEWKKLPHVQTAEYEMIVKQLQDHLDDFLPKLEATTGKRYYPEERGTRGDWRKYLNGRRGYLAQLAARAEGDWRKNKYPSAGIPSAWKKGGGGPADKYPALQNYIDAFTDLAIERIQGDLETIQSFEEFKKTNLPELKGGIKKLAEIDDDFYHILIDEWLSGRRQFSGEHVADWLLSPDGFYDISSPDKTKTIAADWKLHTGWDVRAKAREFLSKAFAVRIDFKADAYYKAAAEAFFKSASYTPSVQKGVPYINEEEEEDSNSETKKIAQDMAKVLMAHIHVQIV